MIQLPSTQRKGAGIVRIELNIPTLETDPRGDVRLLLAFENPRGWISVSSDGQFTVRVCVGLVNHMCILCNRMRTTFRTLSGILHESSRWGLTPH